MKTGEFLALLTLLTVGVLGMPAAAFLGMWLGGCRF